MKNAPDNKLMKTLRSVPIRFSDQALYEENNLPQTVQLLRAGKFFHEGQEIEVKESHLEQMVVNFNEKVRGIDLMIDYSHNSEGEAAAWIDSVYLSEDKRELWAKVLWTDGGKDAVLSHKYRYLSADFNFNYVNNENLSEHGPTLFGAGLTNRPVVKNMQPVIQLSESNQYEEKEDMEELQKQIDDLKAAIEVMKGAMEDIKKPELAEDKKDEEMMAKEAKLAEREKELNEKQQFMEKEAKFNALFAENKVVEAQRKPFLEGDMVKFSELASELNTKPAGNGGTEGKKKEEEIEDAEARVIELAEKKVKEDKVTLSEGIQSVLRENKELAEKYQAKFQ